ncbi:hypothetical protein HYC85_012499 [Camellia sinensis]|uniref:Growth-regulating factor n=1 Tax=Camellia sinensis TaxID=4442 RepID=A0A7J7HFA5_CAMSI|nr:hypothetical protein HYC85_012499 [Camellia sinensis]
MITKKHVDRHSRWNTISCRILALTLRVQSQTLQPTAASGVLGGQLWRPNIESRRDSGESNIEESRFETFEKLCLLSRRRSLTIDCCGRPPKCAPECPVGSRSSRMTYARFQRVAKHSFISLHIRLFRHFPSGIFQQPRSQAKAVSSDKRKEIACLRDVVANQKYCEWHMNRGHHRSRKPMEGQSGHFVSGPTTTTTVKLASFTSAALVVPRGSTTNSLSLSHHPQLKNLQPGTPNPCASTPHINRFFLNNENVGETIQDATDLSMLSITLLNNPFDLKLEVSTQTLCSTLCIKAPPSIAAETIAHCATSMMEKASHNTQSINSWMIGLKPSSQFQSLWMP